MAGRVEARLAELGIALPEAAAPVANYVPAVEAAGLLFVSGQLPLEGGRLALRGRLGAELDVAAGARAARLCALNVLAQAKAALGGLDRITRLIEVRGFVACTPEFTDHPAVVNGASDLFVEVLGEAGRHARFAVGCPSLPLGAPVEIAAVFRVDRAP